MNRRHKLPTYLLPRSPHGANFISQFDNNIVLICYFNWQNNNSICLRDRKMATVIVVNHRTAGLIYTCDTKPDKTNAKCCCPGCTMLQSIVATATNAAASYCHCVDILSWRCFGLSLTGALHPSENCSKSSTVAVCLQLLTS